jgi:rhodanese-related sulfurtransferase
MTQNSIHMTADELKKILEQGSSEYLLVDVRTREEHKEENIGGVNIPVNELESSLDKLDLKKKIITYCRSGGRSVKACEILKQFGAGEIYSLIGGIIGYN